MCFLCILYNNFDKIELQTYKNTRKTTARSESSFCPKFGCDDETPNHQVGRCIDFEDIRLKYLTNKTTTIHSVVDKCNITKLAAYL